MARAIYTLGLLVLLGVSAWSGTSRFMGFIHRYDGEKALTRAEVDAAFDDLVAASRWREDDAYNWILIGRVIQLAQANSVRLDSLKDKQPEEIAAEGVAATTRGLALNPSDAPAWFNVAQAYSAYKTARTRFDRLRAMVEASQAGTDPAEARRELALGGLSSEDRVVVASTLMARDLEPEFSFYHDFLAKLYWDRGLRDEAAREIREAFALTPQLQAHPWISDPEFAESLSEAVLEGIDRAASNPFVDPLAVQLARAEFFEKLGRIDDAIAVYEGLRLQGEVEVEKECLLRLGKLRIGQQDYDASLALLERLVEIDGDGKWGAVANYHLGVVHSSLGDHEKAVEFIRRHLRRIVGSPHVLLTFAGELEAVGEDSEAEKIYLGLIERREEDPRPFVRLIDLLRRKRRHVEALRFAQRFEEEVPGNDEAASLLRSLARTED